MNTSSTAKMMKNAFSLVELSIVLVILGLLVGGVLSGQSLIRAAQMRSVSTEYSKYRAATYTFRDKYFMLPGDMTNATQFWGSLGGTGSDTTCQNIAATGLPTCNGNGDGQVLVSTAAPLDETYRYWQHLANAGLIEGIYSGIQLASGPIRLPGINDPGSKVDSTAVWYPLYMGAYAGTTSGFAGNFGNVIIIRSINSSTVVGGQLMKPEEAWNIDKKFDDGVPSQGQVIGSKGATGVNCTSTAGAAVGPGDTTATYVLTNTSKDCNITFVNQF